MFRTYKYSTIGASHIKRGIPLEDHIATLNLNGVYAYCLSDGLGSKAHSDEGSVLISETVVRFLIDNFAGFKEGDNSFKQLLVETLFKTVGKYAIEKGYEFGSLMATFLAYATDGTKNVLVRLGDGKISMIYDDDGLDIYEETKDEFVERTTTFRSENALEEMDLIVNEDCVSISFATCDGLDCLYQKDEYGQNVSDQFAGLITYAFNHSPEEVESAIKSSVDNIASVESDDDCSLVMLIKTNEQTETSKLTEDAIKNVVFKKGRCRRSSSVIVNKVMKHKALLHGNYDKQYLQMQIGMLHDEVIDTFIELGTAYFEGDMVIFR